MLQDYFETLVFLEKHSVSDGMGGFIEDYVEGAEFKGGITTDNSIEMRVAEKQGVTSVYTVTMPINVPLKYGDIIKRKSDNKYFRITSNANDMQTPKRANVQFKQAQAESWTREKNMI